MSIDVRIVTDEADGILKAPHFADSQFLPGRVLGITQTEMQSHGQWQVANRTTAGTTVVVSPDPQQAILVTDMIISTDKVANSFVALQYTDGANTEIIAGFDSANAPVALSVSINGRLRGWGDARLEMVTTSTVNATVMIGYMKVSSVQLFAEWDAER